MTPKKSRETAAAKTEAPAEVPPLNSPQLYINRELSLLAFQFRVLEEAQDERNPLLERVKFLSIVGSNVDEFFMVRVAGLIDQVDAGILDVGPDGMHPTAQLVAIRREVKKLLGDAHKCLHDQLLPALAEAGIEILDYARLNAKQLAVADRYFNEAAFPVLTPLAFDPGRPFPHISNLSLNLAVLIRDKDGVEHFARVKVPDSLPQFIPLKRQRKNTRKRPPREETFVWLEQVVSANLPALFRGMDVIEAHPFHVTRDADIAIKELEAEDLLETIEEGVRQRRFGSVVRLMVNDDMPPHILDILVSNLEIDSSQVYRVRGPLSLSRLMNLYALDRPELKDAPFLPAVPKPLVASTAEEDIFALIRRQNILLHHPFDSFQPVVDFLKKAAKDPNTMAIKMVLYRIGRNSPVVEALLEANEEGKQVAVLVELKARFDEESNIEWARALEREGVHVVYGLLGLKTHCKLLMVVRREVGAIRRYLHLATGNYNVVTSHLYTDIGMLTCDEELGSDATDLFNYLTGYSAKTDYQKLLVSPVNLRARFEAMIRREIALQAKGVEGRLIFKMNALVDPHVIQLLYQASQAGVKIDLLVRGICCLRPGIAGVSDNIQVISVVGRFLEHSRVYYFRNGGKEEIYLGSADLMPRNIDRRVEVLFPLEGPGLVEHVRDKILKTYLADTIKGRQMKSDGTYVRRSPSGRRALNSQEWLVKQATAAQK
ncbi:MAG TPA: polyphosphate kinase 1 [Bryobacteraceae bacterium]|nr:polyphosphate kinase 1 [Bryobacteraceae bacterium]